MPPDLFNYRPAEPAAPGYKDLDTARRAADSMKDRAPLLQRRCLDALRAAPGGLTADQIAAQIGETILSVRPRVTELLRDGRVRDSGQRRQNESGRSAKVWVIA